MDIVSLDRFGALCRHTHTMLSGSPSGPLAGLMFVAKDVFDVEGVQTGAGSPDWLRTHPPALKTAPAIERLIGAGASLIGKSQTDELAFSLNGQNHHYGMPVNPRAPDRISGGSSSGSAVAVSGELVDFAIGTDCGGSVRLPASYCGILGFRPTHGRISLDNAVPLAPSFDTLGWFAREPEVLEKVGHVLLPESLARDSLRRLYIATDLFELVPAAVSVALEQSVHALRDVIGHVERGPVIADMAIDSVEVFRTIQGAEVWAAHGEWVRTTQPDFGPGIRERFEFASHITEAQLARAKEQRRQFASHMARILEGGSVMCLPTAPGIAPLRNASLEELESFRARALRLLSVAGLSGLPQVSLPVALLNGCPIGLSVIAAAGADHTLLALAGNIMDRLVSNGRGSHLHGPDRQTSASC
jgi:amidase